MAIRLTTLSTAERPVRLSEEKVHGAGRWGNSYNEGRFVLRHCKDLLGVVHQIVDRTC